jgi:hypothetical protein
MKRKCRITLTLTLALLGASPILAAPKEAAPEAEAEDATSPDLKAAQAAKLSVIDAIAIAEKHSNGGNVLEVSFKVQGHGTRLFYELLSCGEPCGRMGRGGWPAMRSLQQWMASLRAARRIFLSRSKPTRKMD